MLANPDQYILQVLFARKDNCVLWGDIAEVIFSYIVVSGIFRQHWLDDISMQCWEAPGQISHGFLPIKCYPKSIKITLNMIFSHAMLSGASRTILHNFSCTMLSQEILMGQYCTDKSTMQCYPSDNNVQEKSCSMLSQYSWDNITQVKILSNIVREAPGNIVP